MALVGSPSAALATGESTKPLEGPGDVWVHMAESRQEKIAPAGCERVHRVHKTDGSRAGLGVKHRRLCRLQAQCPATTDALLQACPEHGSQGANLDRIPKRRSGTMQFCDVNGARRDASRAYGGPDDLLLRRPVWRGQRAAPPILLRRTPRYEHKWRITRHFIIKSRQKMHHASLGPAVSVGPRVEGLAATVPGQHRRTRQDP